MLQAVARDRVVPVGRHGDHRRVGLAEDRAIVSKGAGGQRLRAREVGVHHRADLHAGQPRELLRVIAAHVAGADDRDLQ